MAERIELSEAQAALMETFRHATHWDVRFKSDVEAHRELVALSLLRQIPLSGKWKWVRFIPTALGRTWLKEHGHG